jgi:hypothetical protein
MGNSNTKATDRYRKENVKQVIVRFFPAERPLLEHMDAQGPRATYIKRLIADDMARDLPAWCWEQDGGNKVYTNGAQWLELAGEHSFTLHDVEVDGELVKTTIHADTHDEAGAEANRFLAKLRTGWRPLGW